MKQPAEPDTGKRNALSSNAREVGLAWQIVSITVLRLLLNTARRFAYPFAPALSRGIQVPLTAITSLIAINQISSILGVAGGYLADRWGYRRMMLMGLGLLILGMLSAGCWPHYLTVMLGLFLAGLAKSTFDPAVQAYMGQRVPFAQRARAIGIMEVAWAGSALAGIPLMGYAMAHQGWSAPFWYLGILGIAGLLYLARVIPKAGHNSPDQAFGGFRRSAMRLIKERPAMGLLGYGFWMSLGNDQLFVVYGAWLEQSFHVGLVSLGLSTSVIGLAELSGEGLTAFLGDRFGLKRAIIWGSLCTMSAYLVLILLDGTLSLSLVSLFILFLSYEFSIVSSISLSTEALPPARATMLAAFYAAAGIGRMVGAFLGGLVWSFGGMAAVCTTSALVSAAGLACLWWGYRPQTPR